MADPALFVSHQADRPEKWRSESRYLCDIVGIADLDRLVSSGGLAAAALTVANFGRRVPDSQYTMRRHGAEPAVSDLCDPLAIAAYLQEGYSLHISNMQRYHSRLLSFSDRLAFELGCVVKADAFFTPSGEQAFAEHYDTNDNLICQVAGTKRWRLYRPSYTNPLTRHPWAWADASDELRRRLTDHPPDVEFTLEPGETLWIPRGWFHAGTATGDLSLHITFRPETVTAEWLAQKLVEHLSDRQASLRENVRAQSLRSPECCELLIKKILPELVTLLSVLEPSAVGFDLWRAHGERFLGPVLRPVSDVCAPHTTGIVEDALWLRPEAACGFWRCGDELHVHLGTARKILGGMAGHLIEGLLKAGDHVSIRALRTSFPDLVDWTLLVPELRALGMIVSRDELPAHWLADDAAA